MLRPLAGLCLAFAATQSSAQTDSLASDRVVGALGAQLDSQLRRFAEYGFSGTVLVVRDRRVVLLKGYGLADVARGVRNSAATRFEMNSMTKMFTGVGILQLAAAGRLQLSDRVEQHLGEFPPGKRGATIEQLTSHTSGLIVEGSDLAGDPREAFVRDIKQSPREAPPGEQYRYTNAGYSLLGVIIEIASGQPYEAYLREHIFAPAGMRTAVFRDQVPERDPLFAHGYVGTPAGLEPGPHNPYAWGTRGAGGVWTTVGDMYRWLVSVEDSGTIAGPQRKLLYSPPKPPSEEAFGWHVSTGSPAIRARIDKGGGSDDFASQLLYYPNERVAIIWASNNLRQRWRQTLNQTLPAIVFGDSVTPLPRIAIIPRDALTDYAGRYFSGGATLVIRTARNYLYAETNTLDVPTNVMFFPEDRDNFTGYDPSTRRFTRLHFARDDRQAVVIDLANGGRVEGRR